MTTRPPRRRRYLRWAAWVASAVPVVVDDGGGAVLPALAGWKDTVYVVVQPGTEDQVSGRTRSLIRHHQP